MESIGGQYGITLGEIYRGSAPYIPMLLAMIALLLIFPDLALWLPKTMR